MTKTTTYKSNHNTFGGLIYPSDFYTNCKGNSGIADRITQDQRFDESCKHNIINRNLIKENSNI